MELFRKIFGEFIGTFMLVFVGTGVVVLVNPDPLTIGLAFGLTVTLMDYAIGHGGLSDGHFNPAVTVAMAINDRVPVKDGLFYILAQFIGGICASACVGVLGNALGVPAGSYGQTDFTNINAGMAFAFEALITFLFIFVILMVTSKKYGSKQMASIAIGAALGLLIILASNLTGGSLNPARSFGPAIFAGGTALSHYWVFLCAPLVGAIIAAFIAKFMGSEEGLTEADD